MRRVVWTSPAAYAAGRAVVNQARLAVLAMRLPSLTHAAIAAVMSGVCVAADNSASRHRLAPFIFAFGECEDSRSRAAHSDLWPEMSRRAL